MPIVIPGTITALLVLDLPPRPLKRYNALKKYPFQCLPPGPPSTFLLIRALTVLPTITRRVFSKM